MVLAFTFLLASTASAQSGWPAPQQHSKPWTRWWWHGSAVDRDTLRTELQRFHDAGIGGVEITPIYGVKGHESKSLLYLSPQWLDIVAYAAAEARKLGLGVDLTPGSGWRIGGPLVSEKNANASARIHRIELDGGTTHRESFSQRIIQGITAYPVSGDPVDLTSRIQQGAFEWTAPAGHWTLYVLEKILSGEKVKRPAPGGEGYTIDTYSKAAFEEFFQAFDARTKALPSGTIRAWFHDSFEYTGNWSGDMPDQFRQRRGYDIRRYLRELSGEGDPAISSRVLSDYRETLSDLLLENVIQPLAAWSKSRGSVSRNQAHGSPGNLLDLYAASDIPETEIFGKLGGSDSDPLINKFASSAAHTAGKPLTSSESFTWLNEHFNVTLGEMKRATDQLLLAGINHIVFHGTAYSPPAAAWPGWVFYASSQINPRNPIWRDLPPLNTYITRAQSVLQAGTPSNDVLLYWPYYDVLDNPGPMFQQLAVHSPAWFYQESAGAIARELWTRGFSFDYASDRQLRAAAPNYRAVVIPETTRMPVETFETLLDLARAGTTVIFLKSLPADVPGLGQLELRRARLTQHKASLHFRPRSGIPEASLGSGRVLLSASIERALTAAQVPRETASDDGIAFVRRAYPGGYYYFLVNSGDTAYDASLRLSVPVSSALLMDPMSGAIGRAQVTNGAVRIQLAPAAAIIVKSSSSTPLDATPWIYTEPAGPTTLLDGSWTARPIEGGPELPPTFTTPRLDHWTSRGADWERFAGTVRYSITFEAPPGDAAGWLIDLGSVLDSATVRLNGHPMGTLLLPPFRFKTGRLRTSGNLLEIDVTNVAANRIRDLDRRNVNWRIFHDINFVNLRYQPFDASAWPVRPAGLGGPVHLTPVK